MAFGEVFSSKNGLNGLIFGLWVDMDQIEKITEGIWDFLIFSHFMGLFDAKFCPFFDFSQNFDLLCAIKPRKIKKSLIPSVIFFILPISTHWPKISPFGSFIEK